MECENDFIQELLNETNYQFQQQQTQPAVFSAIETDCLGNYSCDSGYHRLRVSVPDTAAMQLGCRNSNRFVTDAKNLAAPVDDLSGLDTWDFAVMRCEFGDLQSYDSAALIDLYKLAASEAAMEFIDLTGEDEKQQQQRSRSDSGYSTGSIRQQQQQQQQHQLLASTAGWCHSPACLSCASSSDAGVDSPTSSLLASPTPPLPTHSQPPALQQQQQQWCLSKRARSVTSFTISEAHSGVRKRARKQRAKPSKCRQLQLWQFLYQQLDAPTDIAGLPAPSLRWENRQEGVFRISNPTGLAEAWGSHRRRENMTYEKMSRTLRYYYDRRLITKVTGKQHTYRFHYDQFPEQI